MLIDLIGPEVFEVANATLTALIVLATLPVGVAVTVATATS
jgi:hypothetical protein